MTDCQGDTFFLEFANADNVISLALKRWGLVPPDTEEDKITVSGEIAKSYAPQLTLIIAEQERLKTILSELVENREIRKTEELDYYLKRHGLLLKLEVIDGQVEYVFNERGHVLTAAIYGEDVIAGVANSLITFLRSGNIGKLRKCKWCHGFFIYRRIDQMYCNQKCRYAYHTNKQVRNGKAAEKMRKMRKLREKLP